MYQKNSRDAVTMAAPSPAPHTHKSARARFLIVFLLVFAIFLTLMPLQAAAGGSTLQFSYYPGESITLTLGGGALTVANLPNNGAFQKIWLSIRDGAGRTRIENSLIRDENGSVSMSLQALSAGDYYVEFYFSTGENKYVSYVFGTSLRFRWQNGAGTFADSPVLEHNRRLYEGGRTDDTALAYYLLPTANIQSTNAAIVKLAAEITENISGDYEKTRALHDWVCNNLWYDLDSVNTGKRQSVDAVTTLNNRRGVCSGFSNLLAALLRASDIPAKTVRGTAVTIATDSWTQDQLSGKEVNHAWVEAYVKGRWMIIDATWNCDNDYEGGRKTKSGGLFSYRYFDAKLDAFSLDHRILEYEDALIGAHVPPSDWAAEPIAAAIAHGLVPRYLRTGYKQAITRAEFCALATIFYEAVTGTEITGRKGFDDTNDVNVEKMAAIGVVQGIGYGYFLPNSLLTREQAATMLSRLANALGKPIEGMPPIFSDSSSISPWAYDAIGEMQASGVMGGIGFGLFGPKHNYTREQSIVTIWRLCELIV